MKFTFTMESLPEWSDGYQMEFKWWAVQDGRVVGKGDGDGIYQMKQEFSRLISEYGTEVAKQLKPAKHEYPDSIRPLFEKWKNGR